MLKVKHAILNNGIVKVKNIEVATSFTKNCENTYYYCTNGNNPL